MCSSPTKKVLMLLRLFAISDPTVIVRNLCRGNTNEHIFIKYRCFKKLDEEKFLDDLTNIPWSILSLTQMMHLTHGINNIISQR